jgi:SAM-dependent methyltransferase
VLLPHVLEFSDNPHQVLREVSRILMPEGHVVVSGFNPWSLWGARSVLGADRGEFPWRGQFMAARLGRMALLGFEIRRAHVLLRAPGAHREVAAAVRVPGGGRGSLVAVRRRRVLPARHQARARHADDHAAVEAQAPRARAAPLHRVRDDDQGGRTRERGGTER